MSSPTFAATHNLLALLEKPVESNGFEQIIDFLNANPIKYALMVSPMVYSSCIKQFWATVKVKKVNGAKTTAWNEFSSTMASAIICLANNQKFNFSKYILANMVKNLEGGVKFFMFPRFLQVFLNTQVEGMTKHKETFIVSSHTKKIFANIRRQADGFSGVVTPLFESVMVQANEEVGDPTDATQIPTIDQPSISSRPQKKQKPTRKLRKEIESPQHVSADEDHVSTFSNAPLPSGEDSSDLNELMVLLFKLKDPVLDCVQFKYI
ncbi:hypothetical protein Tco_0337836 [Tanacetum coccineum]